MLRPFTSLRALLRPAGIFCGRHGVASGLELRSSFTTSVAANLKQLPPRPKHPPESEIEESYLKGSGPGGQKIVRHPSLPNPLLTPFPHPPSSKPPLHR